jgi:hypothetical protein
MGFGDAGSGPTFRFEKEQEKQTGKHQLTTYEARECIQYAAWWFFGERALLDLRFHAEKIHRPVEVREEVETYTSTG